MAEPVVLVVDDSPTVRKIVQLTLSREGIHVVTAGDGLSALAAVADAQPDLILLDIVLPRMDGYSICQVVRKNMAYRDIPIIMLSGKDGLFDKMRGKWAGSSDYITKPFDSGELVDVVKRHLRVAGSARSRGAPRTRALALSARVDQQGANAAGVQRRMTRRMTGEQRYDRAKGARSGR